MNKQNKIESKNELPLKNYSETVFKSCRFIESDWRQKTFQNCCFDSCNLTLVNLEQARFQEVSFKNCKIVGVKFYTLHNFSFDFSFEGSVLINCNFSNLSLIKTPFLDCEIKECYFNESLLREADFTGSSLANSVFQNSDLRKANFKEAKNYIIDPTINKMAKAVFSFPHAMGLLHGLDVKIEDF